MKTADIIVMLLMALVVFAVCLPLIRRMRAREDCCGNQQIRVRRKRLKNPAGKYTLRIEGMHCQNCKKRVTEAVNEMEGLSCRVSLEKNEAVIFYEKSPMKEAVIKRLGELNFAAYDKEQ